jgi:hypothetical protein
MKVSFFKSILDTAPHLSKDVSFFLDRIRNGKSKEVVTKLRLENDLEQKKVIKKSLPVVCYGGEFTKRGNKFLKVPSGLLTLDFDKLPDVEAKKKELIEYDFIFACWVSPSGDGVKALVKIPTVENDEVYKQYFKQVKKKFDDVDESGKDIARACFESYDPNIYINLEAKNFELSFDEIVIVEPQTLNLGSITNIPLTDQDEIANRLMYWFKKHFDSSKRNYSLFRLANFFNEFGVSKITCVTYLSSYTQEDFDIEEIQSLINSAYKKTSSYGTKQFEDKSKKQKLHNLVLSGKSNSEIINEFKDVDEVKLSNEIQIAKTSLNLSTFWKLNDENKLEILPYRFKLYLESINYYKYYPVDNAKTFIFITKKNNFINNISEFQIKDRVMYDLIERNEIDVFNVLADKTKVFTNQYLSMIDTAEINIEKDGVDFAMIYYKNCAVKVFEDREETFDYEDLNGYVWENQIIQRDFIKADHHESMFRSFIWFISGEDVERYNTMKSVIGYLLHSYKTSANNKAIILNDETVAESPNGGSGKGILINSISQMKKVSTIDGKTFDFNKSFPYQTVSTDCQVLAFDDVKKNFDFERLFSVITEGLTIEYKGKDAIKIPVKDSPKIVISTNYTIKADGGSFQRRIFEVELSSYFGVHRTPLDQFGCMLFEDWTVDEWARFDHFMINCLKYFLKNGLVVSEPKNLKLRKFINETCQEFYDFTNEGSIKVNFKYNKNEIFEIFKNDNLDLKWLNKRIFNKWMLKYADYKGFSVDEKASNGQRWITIIDESQPKDEEDGIW